MSGSFDVTFSGNTIEKRLKRFFLVAKKTTSEQASSGSSEKIFFSSLEAVYASNCRTAFSECSEEASYIAYLKKFLKPGSSESPKESFAGIFVDTALEALSRLL